MFHLIVSVFKIAASMALLLNCGITGLSGSKNFIKIPVRTKTEIFHASLSKGEVQNLYGINLGVANIVKESLVGIQVGGANISQGDTYAAAQIAFYNTAEKAGFALQTGGVNNVEGGAGVQVGLYNSSEKNGILAVQAGGVNHAESSAGVQVGLYNNEKKEFLRFRPGDSTLRKKATPEFN